MKKKIVFRGVATALVTPLKDGKIDFASLGNIIDLQLKSGIDALVIGGTTGEASTLSDEERIMLFEYAKDKVKDSVPLIFGTGSNSTKKALEYTKIAASIGASAALVVTPYYNKGTEDGIINHYFEIANCSDLPIILYNVPGRTGVNLSLSAVMTLSSHENIIGIKEASDSIDRLTSLATIGEDMTIYSGNDSQIYTTLALGGLGVISVASNIIPDKLINLTREYLYGNKETALTVQKQLLPFIGALFAETNPTPIKYAMSLLGLCSEQMRLPLSPPRDSTKALIESELKKTGLLF